MKIVDRLDGDTVAKLNDLKRSNGKCHTQSKKRKKRNSERLTRREIEELMDINRPTYKRVRGAIRRK